MNSRLGLWLLAFALVFPVSAVAQAPAPQPPPVEAFASLPEMSKVCMTPDGQKVAWANDPGGKPIIVIAVSLSTCCEKCSVAAIEGC